MPNKPLVFPKNRASIPRDAACWVKTYKPGEFPPHTVTVDKAGFFRVLSGRSGKHYRVSAAGECNCAGFTASTEARCSHLSAVMDFAADVLRKRAAHAV
jgi:hypothetical protein